MKEEDIESEEDRTDLEVMARRKTGKTEKKRKDRRSRKEIDENQSKLVIEGDKIGKRVTFKGVEVGMKEVIERLERRMSDKT